MNVEPAQVDVGLSGSGPAVVFTHGWTDSRSSWDGVINYLSPDYSCTSWSLRAHGESEVTEPGTYTRDHALADFESVTDTVAKPYVLVGHSLGGYLSLAHTLRYPEQVRALVLVGAGPGFSKPEAMESWNASVDKTAAKKEVPEGSQVISQHFDSWVIDGLASIEVPTLVIIGEGDKQFAASASVFERRLDVRNSVVVDNAGHSVHRQQPKAVASSIASFLELI